MITTVDRIAGCLKGVALGDAIGKQTEGLSAENVLRWYPHGVRGFEGEPGTIIPRYIGNTKHEWRVAETTDDTERTIAVARAIIDSGSVIHESVGRRLLTCTKCVHPGVRSLWEFHQAADPARKATCHDGCGGAIRVAPVGIFHTSQSLDALVSSAYEASISTHAGSLALAAAAANAAAVSSAIEGAASHEIFECAERAAALAEARWPAGARPAFAAALRSVHDDLAGTPQLDATKISAHWFPKEPLTIVPLAIALGTVMSSAEAAILLASNIGGDSDSVASIAGGILGARYPQTIDESWYHSVERANRHDLISIARQLAPLRH